MTADERLFRVIFEAVDEVNEFLPKQQRIEKSSETVLIAESSHLDSLSLVSLITTIEQKVEDEYSVTINLADGDFLSQVDNPFKDFATLANHIALLIGAKQQ